ncbi:MAG: hypothetical protein EPO26_03160 [Chloroflexota bacterium]|nr:MAG: hypothetical protein EPO26_03160 [Chloroflexota bacterium]
MTTGVSGLFAALLSTIGGSRHLLVTWVTSGAPMPVPSFVPPGSFVTRVITRSLVVALFALVAVFLTSTAAAATPGDIWQPRSPFPDGRKHALVANVGDRMFVGGGVRGSQESHYIATPMMSVYEYDHVADRWLNRASMPVLGEDQELVGLAGTDARLYGVLSHLRTGSPATSVLEYDFANDAWRTIAAMPSAPRRPVISITADGWILVIDAGYEPGAVLSFDPEAGRWQTHAPWVNPSHAETATLAPNGLVVVAGSRESGRVTSFDGYDITTDTWRSLANHPATPVGNRYLTTIAGRVILFSVGDSGTLISAYDPLTDSWMRLSREPSDSLGGAAGRAGDGVLINSGQNQANYFVEAGSTWYASADQLLATAMPVETAVPTNGDLWRQCGTFEFGKYNATTATLGDRLFVNVGQFVPEPVFRFYEYVPNQRVWIERASIERTARAQQVIGLVATNRELFAVIQRDHVGTTAGLSLHRYVVHEDRWVMVADRPIETASPTVAVDATGSVFLFGGVDTPGRVISFDPNTGLWRQRAPWPRPRYDSVATLLADGTILVAGGVDARFLRRTGSVDVFNPATDSWERRSDAPDFDYVAESIISVGGYAVLDQRNADGAAAISAYSPSADAWTRLDAPVLKRMTDTLGRTSGALVVVAGVDPFSPFTPIKPVECAPLVGLVDWIPGNGAEMLPATPGTQGTVAAFAPQITPTASATSTVTWEATSTTIPTPSATRRLENTTGVPGIQPGRMTATRITLAKAQMATGVAISRASTATRVALVRQQTATGIAAARPGGPSQRLSTRSTASARPSATPRRVAAPSSIAAPRVSWRPSRVRQRLVAPGAARISFLSSVDIDAPRVELQASHTGISLDPSSIPSRVVAGTTYTIRVLVMPPKPVTSGMATAKLSIRSGSEQLRGTGTITFTEPTMRGRR